MAKIMVMIRMEQYIKDFFKKFADKERRSMTNFIVHSVLEYIKSNYDKELPTGKKK